MAEDRYRLAPLRDARERDERLRRGELASAIGDAKHVDARRAALAARVDAARAAAAAAARTSAGTAAQLVLADRFAARRRRELADALAELDRAETALAAQQGVVDAARTTLARARAEREVIERHFARWRDERRKLADRRED